MQNKRFRMDGTEIQQMLLDVLRNILRTPLNINFEITTEHKTTMFPNDMRSCRREAHQELLLLFRALANDRFSQPDKHKKLTFQRNKKKKRTYCFSCVVRTLESSATSGQRKKIAPDTLFTTKQILIIIFRSACTHEHQERSKIQILCTYRIHGETNCAQEARLTVRQFHSNQTAFTVEFVQELNTS